MTMRSLKIADTYAFLFHNEEKPTITSPRHPLVVFCHLPFAVCIVIAYLLTTMTLGQTILFLITFALYLSSAAYHAWRPDRFLRFIDQTMISWFVLAIPVPFVYHNTDIMLLLGTLATLSVLNKWYQWEPSFAAGSIVFLCLGSISTFVMLTVGLPTIKADLLSFEAVCVYAAILFFMIKLVIYHYEIRLVRNVLESPELGHCALSVGVIIILYLTATNPV
jgi:hypothetical protein